MSDLIKELRDLAASEEVADRAADELERLTKLNSQKNADIGDWAEKYAEKCNEAAALKRENEELRQRLEIDSNRTLQQGAQEDATGSG